MQSFDYTLVEYSNRYPILFLLFTEQVQNQMSAATSGPLVTQLGSLLSQFGISANDIMGLLRTGSDFIGSFRVNVLQYIAQQRM